MMYIITIIIIGTRSYTHHTSLGQQKYTINRIIEATHIRTRIYIVRKFHCHF